jgi:hypothetical protein
MGHRRQLRLGLRPVGHHVGKRLRFAFQGAVPRGGERLDVEGPRRAVNDRLVGEQGGQILANAVRDDRGGTRQGVAHEVGLIHSASSLTLLPIQQAGCRCSMAQNRPAC